MSNAASISLLDDEDDDAIVCIGTFNPYAVSDAEASGALMAHRKAWSTSESAVVGISVTVDSVTIDKRAEKVTAELSIQTSTYSCCVELDEPWIKDYGPSASSPALGSGLRDASGAGSGRGTSQRIAGAQSSRPSGPASLHLRSVGLQKDSSSQEYEIAFVQLCNLLCHLACQPTKGRRLRSLRDIIDGAGTHWDENAMLDSGAVCEITDNTDAARQALASYAKLEPEIFSSKSSSSTSGGFLSSIYSYASGAGAAASASSSAAASSSSASSDGVLDVPGQRIALLWAILYSAQRKTAHCYLCGRLHTTPSVHPRTCASSVCIDNEAANAGCVDLYTELRCKRLPFAQFMLSSTIAALGDARGRRGALVYPGPAAYRLDAEYADFQGKSLYQSPILGGAGFPATPGMGAGAGGKKAPNPDTCPIVIAGRAAQWHGHSVMYSYPGAINTVHYWYQPTAAAMAKGPPAPRPPPPVSPTCGRSGKRNQAIWRTYYDAYSKYCLDYPPASMLCVNQSHPTGSCAICSGDNAGELIEALVKAENTRSHCHPRCLYCQQGAPMTHSYINYAKAYAGAGANGKPPKKEVYAYDRMKKDLEAIQAQIPIAALVAASSQSSASAAPAKASGRGRKPMAASGSFSSSSAANAAPPSNTDIRMLFMVQQLQNDGIAANVIEQVVAAAKRAGTEPAPVFNSSGGAGAASAAGLNSARSASQFGAGAASSSSSSSSVKQPSPSGADIPSYAYDPGLDRWYRLFWWLLRSTRCDVATLDWNGLPAEVAADSSAVSVFPNVARPVAAAGYVAAAIAGGVGAVASAVGASAVASLAYGAAQAAALSGSKVIILRLDKHAADVVTADDDDRAVNDASLWADSQGFDDDANGDVDDEVECLGSVGSAGSVVDRDLDDDDSDIVSIKGTDALGSEGAGWTACAPKLVLDKDDGTVHPAGMHTDNRDGVTFRTMPGGTIDISVDDDGGVPAALSFSAAGAGAGAGTGASVRDGAVKHGGSIIDLTSSTSITAPSAGVDGAVAGRKRGRQRRAGGAASAGAGGPALASKRPKRAASSHRAKTMKRKSGAAGAGGGVGEGSGSIDDPSTSCMWTYHGSGMANWLSIIRNGLCNLSNTRHMLAGAAYGAGVYLSAVGAMSVSWQYSGGLVGTGGAFAPSYAMQLGLALPVAASATGSGAAASFTSITPAALASAPANKRHWTCLAVCKVADGPHLKQHAWTGAAPGAKIYTCSDGDKIRVSYLILQAGSY